MHYCAPCKLPTPADACLNCGRPPTRDIPYYCFFCEREAGANPCGNCAGQTVDTFDDDALERLDGITKHRGQVRQNFLQVLIWLPIVVVAFLIMIPLAKGRGFGLIGWALTVLISLGATWLIAMIAVRVIPRKWIRVRGKR